MSDSVSRLYEDLANHFAKQGESRRRDECWVLAADAALSEGRPDDADRLRKRLLGTTPHHLLRPYASMGEAMQSNDVRDYVADLRKQLPPAMAEKMLNRASAPYDVAPPLATLAKPKPKPAPKAKSKPAAIVEAPGTLSYVLSLFVLLLGIAFALALFFVTFGFAFMD